MPEIRQYEVTHIASGLVTYVNSNGCEGFGHYEAMRKAGNWHAGDCSVHVVPKGEEWDLPFDEIPLGILPPKRAAVRRRRAA